MNQHLPRIKVGLPSNPKQKSKGSRDWHRPLRPMLYALCFIKYLSFSKSANQGESIKSHNFLNENKIIEHPTNH